MPTATASPSSVASSSRCAPFSPPAGLPANRPSRTKAVYSVYSYSQNGVPAVGFAVSSTSGTTGAAASSSFVPTAVAKVSSVAIASVSTYEPLAIVTAASSNSTGTATAACVSIALTLVLVEIADAWG